MYSYTPSELFSVPPAVIRSGELLPKSKLILIDAMSRADSWVILNRDGTSRTLPFDRTDELRARAGLTDRRTWQKHRDQLERFGCLKQISGFSKGKHWKAFIWSWGQFWTAHDVFSLVDLADDSADWPVNKTAPEQKCAFSLGVYKPLHVEKIDTFSLSHCNEIDIGFAYDEPGAASYAVYRSMHDASQSPAFKANRAGLVSMAMPGGHGFCEHFRVYWGERSAALLSGSKAVKKGEFGLV